MGGKRRVVVSNREVSLSNRVVDTQKVPVDEDMQYEVM